MESISQIFSQIPDEYIIMFVFVIIIFMVIATAMVSLFGRSLPETLPTDGVKLYSSDMYNGFARNMGTNTYFKDHMELTDGTHISYKEIKSINVDTMGGLTFVTNNKNQYYISMTKKDALVIKKAVEDFKAKN